jgi:putative ABC transport system permease protein
VVVVNEVESERIATGLVSARYFEVFGVTPVLGRGFDPEEHVPGAAPVVLLSHAAWRNRWGGDASVLGRTIMTPDGENGALRTHRIVGVLPEGFKAPSRFFTGEAEMWAPLAVHPESWSESRTSRTLELVGRLRPDTSVHAVQAELRALAESMSEEHPRAYQWGEEKMGIGAVPLLDGLVGGVDRTLFVFFGAAFLLLLISGVNVAGLLLARATSRSGELALRTAIGAGRLRIVAQLLTESAVLSALSGMLGILLAYGGVWALHAFGPADMPRLSDIQVDAWVLGFGLLLAVLVGTVFGLAPALLSTRAGLARATRDGGSRAGTARARVRLRSLLIASETALAVVLLSGAGLLLTSYVNLRNVDPGFDPENVSFMEVGLGPRYDSEEMQAELFRELQERVRSLPGVESASIIQDPPLTFWGYWTPDVYARSGGQERSARLLSHNIGSDYFETLGIRLLKGRGITKHDRAGGEGAVVVSAAAAETLWPGENPLGQRVRLNSESFGQLSVVGVVEDVRQSDLATAPRGELYLSYAAFPFWNDMYLMVRGSSELAILGPRLRMILEDLDPTVPFSGVNPLTGLVAESLAEARFNALLIGVFGAVALLLAATGIYGTLQYLVAQSRSELGVRIALGATAGRVLLQVLRQGMTPALTGIVAGLAATLALSRVLEKLVFGIGTVDLPTFAITSLVLASAGLLACAPPAMRAARTDPMESLRAD